MATTARSLTYDDYTALPDEGAGYELIGGKLFEMPSPSQMHQELLARLFIFLRAFVGRNQLGKVYFAPFNTRLSPHDVVQLDLFFAGRDRMDAFGGN